MWTRQNPRPDEGRGYWTTRCANIYDAAFSFSWLGVMGSEAQATVAMHHAEPDAVEPAGAAEKVLLDVSIRKEADNRLERRAATPVPR